MVPLLTVEKVLKYEKSLKNRAKRARKVFAQLAACLLTKGLQGARGRSPQTLVQKFSQQIGFIDRLERHHNGASFWLLKKSI